MNASAGLVRSGATKQRQWVAEGLKTLFFRPPHADPNRNRSTSIAETAIQPGIANFNA